ncbi:MAG: ureidoglycolate lyase [Pseudomonadota bacterium]
MRELTPEPLCAERFSAFGEIVDLREATQIPINYGLTTRFNDLATVDTLDAGGRTIVNVFRSNPIPLPHKVKIMERHPLGSQAFIPLSQRPFLVMVAPASEEVSAQDLVLFVTDGLQGVNFHKNTWHHYQMVLGEQADFLVIDRGGPGDNLVEREISGEAIINPEAVTPYCP